MQLVPSRDVAAVKLPILLSVLRHVLFCPVFSAMFSTSKQVRRECLNISVESTPFNPSLSEFPRCVRDKDYTSWHVHTAKYLLVYIQTTHKCERITDVF